jgi:long-chain fatty acid transport protein
MFDSVRGGVMQKNLLMVLLILLICTSLAFGSGFYIYEHSAKATSMCGAFAAQANDGTAVFYNPAGLTQLSGWNFSAGGTYIVPVASFTGPISVDPKWYSETNQWNFFPPNFHASYAINDRLSAGFGLFVPFGLGTDWGEDWVGKHLTTKGEVQAIYLNPVVAYEITEGLSLAAGLSYILGSINLKQAAYFTPRSIWGVADLSGDATALAYNFALRFQATEKLAIGATYRSSAKLDIEGDAKFTFPSSSNPIINAELAALFPDNKGTSFIELPVFIVGGISYDVLDNLTVEFDYFFTGWSSYKELAVDFETETLAITDLKSEKNWKDVHSLRLGLEYRWNDKVALRIGIMRDYDPAPDATVDPLLPSSDRWLYAVGGGYTFSAFTIDLAYMLLLQDDRSVRTSQIPFNGDYKSFAHLFGINLSYSIN